ncbi:hypothetical protein M422DRAFT_260511 [Sphaerobolus stellatus SS14]|uniref:Unplaced genomic scaffold SPHSTscaffold_97, whole genome shotgun sequence n=1 Tax=Sphaerobolus stellatus (strain SS14) TaxID=990650 RepID=A0A0C9VII0_SPHS4|nr:hypothetical protein M422DRAFT_260511 [Sphaerobolus stellatus SS14]
MTDLELPAHMLAGKASTDVIRMEEIPKFDGPAPKLSFDNPYEDEEDRLNKLLDAEVVAASRRKAEEAARAQSKAREDEAREKEKKKELEKEKEKEVGLSGQAKGKARKMPRTPKKITPKKTQNDVQSESEEDEDEDKPQSCIYCMKKTIPCVPQTGKKTAWAIMEGTKQIVESVWKLAGLGRHWDAGHLEVIWHDHQRFMMEIEQRAVVDSAAVDARVLQLLELKSKGVEILKELEKRIRAKRDLVQATQKEQLDDLTGRMDNIQNSHARDQKKR